LLVENNIHFNTSFPFVSKLSNMDPMDDDPMQVEGAAPPDRRFNATGKIDTPNGYSFETGFRPERLEKLWTRGLVKETEDGNLIYVDFNQWMTLEDVPKLEFPKHPVFPIPWRNKHIGTELSKKKIVDGINNIVALNSIPVLMYTPLLFLMLNGIRAGKKGSDVPGHPRVMLSTSVATCYLQVSNLLLSMQSDHVKAYGRVVEKNYKANLSKMSDKFQEKWAADPDYQAYSDHLKELVKKHKLPCLASQPDDEVVLKRYAGYIVSYQMNWLHLLELQILTLSDPLLAKPDLVPRDLGSDFYSQAALPGCNDSMIFHDVAQALEPELLKDQVSYLRLRAANVDCKRLVPSEFSTEQKVAGLSTHFLRTLILVMTS
jgi:hypothetical protein